VATAIHEKVELGVEPTVEDVEPFAASNGAYIEVEVPANQRWGPLFVLTAGEPFDGDGFVGKAKDDSVVATVAISTASKVQQVVGQALMDAFSPVRVGSIIAGLEVPHCHVHLIPIDAESDLNFANVDHDPSPDAMDDAAARIRAALRAAGHGAHVPD